jgi:hypothetical protein
MNNFGNMFGCCNLYNNKSNKKSDIEIKKRKIENENMPYLFSENNTQVNHRPSFSNNNNNQSSNSPNYKKDLEINKSKNEDEEKRSATFQKNIQTIIQKNNIQISNDDNPKPGQTIIIKNNNTVISISNISFISENQEKKKENFSKLLLTGDLFYGKEIIITDTGMVGSKRKKKDGFTVFGLKNSVDHSGHLNNDFIINFNKSFDEIGNFETESGKVFEIIFNKKKKEYTLYFINPFLYLFYKINNFVYFYPGREYFIFVGKIFLSINVENQEKEQIINVQVDNTYENKENQQKYSFSQNKYIITIGRGNCDIMIPEKFISKIHGIIEFSKINQKFYYKDMNSTNGTTLLIKKDDSLRIKGEMNFKLEDVTFRIQEIP